MSSTEIKDFEKLLESLEKAGWHPMLCDTPVPRFDNTVEAGVPTGVGDVVEDMIMLPKELLSMQPEFVVQVRGESMKDAGINNGDSVRVVASRTARDGDIVLALLDGDLTIKTYCEDEDGQPWLVPRNEDFEAFPMSDYDQVSIIGTVVDVIKHSPHVNYRTCIQAIRDAKRKEPQGRAFTPAEVSAAIRQVAARVESGRQWYAVFRVLVDVKFLDSTDFEAFCEMVRNEVPEHSSLPTRVEMQRMAVQSFKRPVAMWSEANAPVQGKRFKDYVKVAQRMQDLLGD